MTQYAVIKLREMACSNDFDIEDLLRRAKTIASLLDITEMEHWSDLELQGYDHCIRRDTPDYRVLRNLPLIIKPTYLAGHTRLNLAKIAEQDKEFYDFLTTIYFSNSITQAHEYSKRKDLLHVPLYPEQENSIRELFPENRDCTYYFTIPSAYFSHILSYVRDQILNWTLKLEKNGILGEDLRFSSDEKAIATANYTTINNTNNFHAPVHNSGKIKANS